MNAFKTLWQNEPLRVSVYTTLVLLFGVLVAGGYVTLDMSNLILAVLALVLGVGGTEVARSQVQPMNPTVNKHEML